MKQNEVVLGTDQMADLDFVKNLQNEDLRITEHFSEVQQFWDLKDHDIPRCPGAYILLARGTRFRYPRGTNTVYYIGQSSNLRRRLREHVKYAIEAADDRKLPLYWPRYEYAAKFGTHYCFIRTWQNLNPRGLEEILMAHFAEKHRGFPVANGAGSWNRITGKIKNK